MGSIETNFCNFSCFCTCSAEAKITSQVVKEKKIGKLYEELDKVEEAVREKEQRVRAVEGAIKKYFEALGRSCLASSGDLPERAREDKIDAVLSEIEKIISAPINVE